MVWGFFRPVAGSLDVNLGLVAVGPGSTGPIFWRERVKLQAVCAASLCWRANERDAFE